MPTVTEQRAAIIEREFRKAAEIPADQDVWCTFAAKSKDILVHVGSYAGDIWIMSLGAEEHEFRFLKADHRRLVLFPFPDDYIALIEPENG